MDKLLAELEEVERLAQELEDLKHDMVRCQTLREAAKQAGDAVRKLQHETQTSTSTQKDKLWLLLPNRTFFELSHETAVRTLEEGMCLVYGPNDTFTAHLGHRFADVGRHVAQKYKHSERSYKGYRTSKGSCSTSFTTKNQLPSTLVRTL